MTSISSPSVNSSSLSPTLSSPGIGSGLDVNSLVQNLVQAEQKPAQLRLDQREATLQTSLSAFGTLKGALGTLSDSLNALNGANLFDRITATISNPALFTASVSSNAASGDHRIEVIQLASAQKLLSTGFTSGTAIGTGTLTIASGGTSFDVVIGGADTTLTGIRDSINDAAGNPGIVASVIAGDDGQHLILANTKTGSTQTITITASGGDGGLAKLAYDPLNGVSGHYTEQRPATDAQIRIDGVLRSSSTNQINNAVDGVNLTLLSADSGNPVNLTLAPDSSGAKNAIKQFVDSYNALTDTLAKLSSYDPTSRTAGPLLGDATARTLGAALRREFSAPLNDHSAQLNVLSAIGITTDKTGKLTLDEARLGAQLETSPSAVAALFTGPGGLVDRMEPTVSSYGGANGLVTARTSSLQQAINGIGQDRTDLAQRMDDLKNRYLAQFNVLDQLLGQLQSTSSFLTQQIANMKSISNSN